LSTRALPTPGELTRQIDQVLGQLRLSQVSAESHASQQGQPEENDLNLVRPRRRPVQRSDATLPSRCVVALLAALAA
jgi:hypothetical protein